MTVDAGLIRPSVGGIGARPFFFLSSFVMQPTGLETHGPLGTFWVAAGLISFYIALIWINSLLPLLINALFTIPVTWLQDYMNDRKAAKAAGK